MSDLGQGRSRSPATARQADLEPGEQRLPGKSPQEERAAAVAQINRTLKVWRSGSAPIHRKADEPDAKSDEAKTSEPANADGAADAKSAGADGGAAEASKPDEQAGGEKDAQAKDEQAGGEKDEEAGGTTDADSKEEKKDDQAKEEEEEKKQPIAAKLDGVGRKIMRSADPSKPRVGMVPGLYDSVNGSPAEGTPMQVGQLSFEDMILDRFPDNNPRNVTTFVRGTHGGKSVMGSVERSLKIENDGTRTLVMNMAFLDEIPKELSWVTDDGKPLVPGQGIPLQTYMTIRQMKIMKIDFGDLGKPNFTKVKMSTIVNRVTIWDLAKTLGGSDAVPTSEQLMQTHSVLYARTPIEQAGAKVIKAELGSPGTVTTADEYGKEGKDDAERQSRGLDPSAKVRKSFDINLEVAPYTPASPVPGEVSDKT